MSGQVFTVAARDTRGRRVLMRVRANDHEQAAKRGAIELVTNPPYRRAMTVLVAIPGGAS